MEKALLYREGPSSLHRRRSIRYAQLALRSSSGASAPGEIKTGVAPAGPRLYCPGETSCRREKELCATPPAVIATRADSLPALAVWYHAACAPHAAAR